MRQANRGRLQKNQQTRPATIFHANVMADENNNRKEKTISLSKLKPEGYRLWVMTTRATLGVHGLLDIVEGREVDPTPTNPDGTVGVINAQLRSRIQKWKRNHELAREALLRSLEPAELVKVDAEDSAFTIWNRLGEEYGQVLDSE